MTGYVAAAVAAGATLIGAAFVIRRAAASLRLTELAIAYGAGFMLAVVLLGMLGSVAQGGEGELVFVLAGYVLVHVSQHVLSPHFHFGEETHRLSRGASSAAIAGIITHTFFDGVTIASAFATSERLGLLAASAIAIHKLPEGVSVASIALAGGRSPSGAYGAAAISACATIAGVALTGVVGGLATHGLALAAGVSLYVAASNLVPEFQHKREWTVTAAFLAGLVSYWGGELLLAAVLGA